MFNYDTFRLMIEEFENIIEEIDNIGATGSWDIYAKFEGKLIKNYNAIITYALPVLQQEASNLNDDLILESLIATRDNIIKTFGKIGSDIEVPTSFYRTIEISNKGEAIKPKSNKSRNEDSDSDEYKPAVDQDIESIDEKNPEDNNDKNNKFDASGSGITNKEINNTMSAPTKIEYLRQASQTINKSFTGDPLCLKSFIRSIKIMQSVTEAVHLNLLKDFILTRLEGKALEVVPEEPENVDAIINALEKYIKPDNSKVITGRMLALRADKLKSSDFSKQAEELAEALQRSLIVEGFPRDKAEELSIEKTIDMCKGIAKTNYVKSVLASASFQSPQDVISKFIIEDNNEQIDKQVLAFRANDFNFKKRNNNRNFNNRNGNRSNRSYYYNNNNNNNNNRRGRNGNRNQGNYQNSNNNQYNDNNNQRRNNNNSSYYRGSPSVRISENLENPQRQTLGDSIRMADRQ